MQHISKIAARLAKPLRAVLEAADETHDFDGETPDGADLRLCYSTTRGYEEPDRDVGFHGGWWVEVHMLGGWLDGEPISAEDVLALIGEENANDFGRRLEVVLSETAEDDALAAQADAENDAADAERERRWERAL